MRIPALLPLLLLAAGCVAPDSRGSDETAAFERELAGRVAGSTETCIPTSQGANLRIVDGRTLVYEQGRTLWVNRLDSPCPGMRPMDTLIVELHGSQYCRGDHFRSTSTGNTIPGPICVLNDFTPYRRAG